MSGQWDRFVEPAARAIFEPDLEHNDTAVPWMEAEARARKMLAVVGPLIAEDTRARVVAAAARAVERTCTTPRANRGDGRGCEDDNCPRHGNEEEAG